VSWPAVTSPRSRPARTALASVTLAVAAVVGGCATGFDAQTTTVYTAPAGADVRTGDVKGLNMLVVADDEGTGTLVAALVNATDEDDELVSLTVADIDSDDSVTVTGLDAPVPLPAGQLVQLADGEMAPVGLEGDPVVAGQVLRINLRFSRAGAVVAEVPVVAREGDYAEVPTPEPPADTAG
jgi:hypothetical protein